MYLFLFVCTIKSLHNYIPSDKLVQYKNRLKRGISDYEATFVNHAHVVIVCSWIIWVDTRVRSAHGRWHVIVTIKIGRWPFDCCTLKWFNSIKWSTTFATLSTRQRPAKRHTDLFFLYIYLECLLFDYILIIHCSFYTYSAVQ